MGRTWISRLTFSCVALGMCVACGDAPPQIKIEPVNPTLQARSGDPIDFRVFFDEKTDFRFNVVGARLISVAGQSAGTVTVVESADPSSVVLSSTSHADGRLPVGIEWGKEIFLRFVVHFAPGAWGAPGTLSTVDLAFEVDCIDTEYEEPFTLYAYQTLQYQN